MTFSERLYQLRKTRGISQEELAGVVGVSRQAVQKWEAGASTPDVDNLSTLADYFQVTLDYLVRGIETAPQPAPVPEHEIHRGLPFYYEYKSHRTLWGLPLVHMKFGYGFCRAKGILAISNSCATGLIAVGGLSAGLLSLGGCSLGLVTVAGLAVGGVAFGGLALGAVALGGLAVGLLSVGGCAIGQYAAGGAAFGTQIAIGDAASAAHVAIGRNVSGISSLQIPSETALSMSVDALCQAARPHLPHTPEWLLRLMMTFATLS